MNGKLLAGGIVLFALLFGGGIYYTQVYAYYQPVSATAPEAQVMLTSVVSGAPEEVIADGFEGIDSDTSPIRFRACFTTPLSQAMLTETYVLHDDPVPLVAPRWFDCFDAKAIGEALESGDALGFMGQENITYGVDRVVAIFPDGRGFAWNQLNLCGRTVFDGNPAPEGCPPAPENY